MSKNITFRTILFFLICAVLLSGGSAIFVGHFLSKTVLSEFQQRELELLFGSIESGPLAFARLHSAEIAQQQLDRLMHDRSVNAQGITSILITNTANPNLPYASWKNNLSTSASCIANEIRDFNYKEHLSPFQVSITRDLCFVPSAIASVKSYALLATALTSILTLVLLIYSLWPAVFSIQQATMALDTEDPISTTKIRLLPIRELVDKAKRNKELEKDAAIAKIATQVTHDIRSPLSALNLSVSSLKDLSPEHADIIRNATNRINQIASDLLNYRGPAKKNGSGDTQISKVIELIAREKRAELVSNPQIAIEVDLDNSSASTGSIDEVTLARLLSNILNNAIDAISSNGKVVLALRTFPNLYSIVIADNGKGIPKEMLSKVGTKGYTFGKSGTGIGLYSAIESISNSGGKLDIQSVLGKGTMVTVTLPR